jgi:hypothetical protein
LQLLKDMGVRFALCCGLSVKMVLLPENTMKAGLVEI